MSVLDWYQRFSKPEGEYTFINQRMQIYCCFGQNLNKPVNYTICTLYILIMLFMFQFISEPSFWIMRNLNGQPFDRKPVQEIRTVSNTNNPNQRKSVSYNYWLLEIYWYSVNRKLSSDTVRTSHPKYGYSKILPTRPHYLLLKLDILMLYFFICKWKNY